MTPTEIVNSANGSGTALVRLRPSVRVTPIPRGIHVRGWSASFTVDGGADVWRLWQRLAPVLAEGVSPDRLDGLTTSRPAARRAIRGLVEQLRLHEMLVGVPAAWQLGGSGTRTPSGAIAGWLEAVAPDPAAAWHRISNAAVRVQGSGILADAALRSLHATGLLASAGAPGPPAAIQLVTDDNTSVSAYAGDRFGFVAAPTALGTGVLDAARIAARLEIRADGQPRQPLAAFVAGAAAHRLACAVAGLPVSPGTDPAGPVTAPHGWPTVLVARMAPLTAAHHPWLLGDLRMSTMDGDSLDAVLARLDAVCDDVLGVLAAPEPGDLPQLPAALATCGTGAGEVAVGIGATTGAARLDAALRAAAGKLAATGAGQLVVAADRRHLAGVLLRRAVAAQPASPDAVGVPEAAWAVDAAARRWWRALTVHLAVPADAGVDQLADGVFIARVRAADRECGWAVEATPGNALAFAALAATAAEQARRAGLPPPAGPSSTTCGAAPQPINRYDPDSWSAIGQWTWPDTGPAEEELQRALRALVPADRHPRPVQGLNGDDLSEALHATGFALGWSGQRGPGMIDHA